MKQRLGNVPVVVGANRYQAGQLAEQRQLGDIFILDDGFQHRRLHRDVDILTIDPVEWAAGETLLPGGRWREPKSASVRAQVACIQEGIGAALPSLPIPSLVVKTEIQGLYKEDAGISPETLKEQAVVAFAGISKPERFFAALQSLGIYPARCVRFRDHHPYSPPEIEKLGGEFRFPPPKGPRRLSRIPATFLCLPISLSLPDFERLMSLILNRLPCSGAL